MRAAHFRLGRGHGALLSLMLLIIALAACRMPNGTVTAHPEAGHMLQFHWVPFGNHRYGLYGYIPDDLPHEDLTHGVIVNYIPVTCSTKGSLNDPNACHPLTINTTGIVSLQKDGLFVIPSRDIDLTPLQRPPTRFWLKTVILKRRGWVSGFFNTTARETIRFVPVTADLVSPGVKVHTHAARNGLHFRFHFNTPVRIDSLGLWLFPSGAGSLLEIPNEQGGTIQVPGMAEWQPPLKPRLVRTPTAGQEFDSWYLGPVDFLYPVDPTVLRLLRQHGDRRHGHHIPVRLRIRATQFGQPPKAHVLKDVSEIELHTMLEIDSGGNSP
ncbi:MAG: hypothetical protein D6717_06565 [Gammaproteobacteria bacterium]|nr:MAG: hypothetical protein D6717_06565 [Gammaproteobacteria bacterium]